MWCEGERCRLEARLAVWVSCERGVQIRMGYRELGQGQETDSINPFKVGIVRVLPPLQTSSARLPPLLNESRPLLSLSLSLSLLLFSSVPQSWYVRSLSIQDYQLTLLHLYKSAPSALPSVFIVGASRTPVGSFQVSCSSSLPS